VKAAPLPTAWKLARFAFEIGRYIRHRITRSAFDATARRLGLSYDLVTLEQMRVQHQSFMQRIVERKQ